MSQQQELPQPQHNYLVQQQKQQQQQYKSLNITINNNSSNHNHSPMNNGSSMVPRTSQSGLVPSSERESRMWVSDVYTNVNNNNNNNNSIKCSTLPHKSSSSRISQDSALSSESVDEKKGSGEGWNSPDAGDNSGKLWSSGKRPHSIDAEFVTKLEQMGLSQSLPYVTGGNTLPTSFNQRL